MIAGVLLLVLSGGIGTPSNSPRIHALTPPKPRIAGRLQGTDQALRFASSTLIFADWLTTVDGIRQGLTETNPILGPRPSIGRVNVMIGAGLLLNTFAVAKIKSAPLPRGVWLTVLLFEVKAVHANRKSGCAFSFSF